MLFSDFLLFQIFDNGLSCAVMRGNSEETSWEILIVYVYFFLIISFHCFSPFKNCKVIFFFFVDYQSFISISQKVFNIQFNNPYIKVTKKIKIVWLWCSTLSKTSKANPVKAWLNVGHPLINSSFLQQKQVREYGDGKKVSIFHFKGKSVVLFPTGKSRIEFSFFLWTRMKTTGKTFMSQSD